jgi:hypothetical protein
MRRLLKWVLLAIFAVGALVLYDIQTGWRGAYWLAVTVLYREVPLPESQIVRDLPYVNGTVQDRTKHRLDLFVPAGRGWPMVVFVHGGGWREGDKGVTVGSADVYGNIGRYLASHGIGASRSTPSRSSAPVPHAPSSPASSR